MVHSYEERPLGVADLTALDAALSAARPMAGNSEFRTRLLEDFDNLQRDQRQPKGVMGLLGVVGRIIGFRALAPAGLLAGVSALGFAAGAASAWGGYGFSDEQAAVFVTAAIDQAFMSEEEIPNWVED